MKKTHVHIIKMGGTIEFVDPAYDAINTRLMKLDTTIDSYLRNVIQPHFDFSTETITSKDSRDIDEDDRNRLATAIEATSHANVLVTHGTFTMKLTAEHLREHVAADKRVILTGAMVPITGFTTSDAGFNLGFAISSFAHLDPGVYLSMNGGVFTPDEADKNTDLLRFE
jgi:L-asparaginase